ncbi:hypothetical protein HMPREF9005_1955 [Actinomyces sp. oral taxon 178 str. F0338]|nr:hypothetical protein HMPREF9005_1955 [Actinomyces sp. oral taxon 178 str. F0338]
MRPRALRRALPPAQESIRAPLARRCRSLAALPLVAASGGTAQAASA